VGDAGQLVDQLATTAATLEVGEHQRPLGAAQRTEGEIRSQRARLDAAVGHGAVSSGSLPDSADADAAADADATSAARSFIIPARILVLAVPSGIPSTSLTSLAVRPQMPAKTSARRCSSGSAASEARTRSASSDCSDA